MLSQSQLNRLLSQPPQYSVEEYCANHHLRYMENPETEAQYLMAANDFDKGIDYFAFGQSCLEQGKTEDAMRMFDQSISHSARAITILPIFTEAYQNLAAAYIIKRDYHKAIEVCRQIQTIEPDVPNLNSEWARALVCLSTPLVKSKKFNDAIGWILEAILKAQRELSITGATTDALGVLIGAYQLYGTILLHTIQTEQLGRNSTAAATLREVLDCEIVCAEKHLLLSYDLGIIEILNEVRELRKRLGVGKLKGDHCSICREKVSLDSAPLDSVRMIIEGYVPAIHRSCAIQLNLLIERVGPQDRTWYKDEKYLGYGEIFIRI